MVTPSTVPTYPGARVRGPATGGTGAGAGTPFGDRFGVGGAGHDPTVVVTTAPTAQFDSVIDAVPEAAGPEPGSPAAEGEAPGTPGGAAPAPSATAAHRRSYRPARVTTLIAAIVAPALLVLVGVTLMTNALAGRSESSSNPPSRPRTTAATVATESTDATGPAEPDGSVPAVTPPVPVIAVPVTGDPADRATAIAQVFLTALANGDFRTARAMTDADVDEQDARTLDSATLIPVTASQVGPDRVAMRLVVVEYRTEDGRPSTTFVCARWDVDTATGRVEQLGSSPLGDRRDGTVVPGDLGVTLATQCEEAPLG